MVNKSIIVLKYKNIIVLPHAFAAEPPMGEMSPILSSKRGMEKKVSLPVQG